MANDVTDAMDLIAEALTDFYGERCPDVHPGCHCCEAWAQYDALAARPEPEGMEPVAWRVKDFADGWILCHFKADAEREAAGTGNLIQPLYAGPDVSRLLVEIASLKARLAEAEAAKAEAVRQLASVEDGAVRLRDALHSALNNRDEAVKAETRKILVRCHDRIHALPRTSDTDLAIAIERLLGRLARGGRHEG